MNKKLRLAANLCLSSYFEDIDPNWALDTTKAVSGTDDAYMVEGADEVWVVFRGTEWSVAEWYRNFQIKKADIEGLGRIHKGFFINIPEIMDILDEHPAFKDKDINFCGHSRGGAMAQLAALMHRNEYKSNPKVYTFGSPRCGDKSFLEAYRGIETLRVVHRLDPIPEVPRWNYWHTPVKVGSWKKSHKMSAYYKTAYEI